MTSEAKVRSDCLCAKAQRKSRFYKGFKAKGCMNESRQCMNETDSAGNARDFESMQECNYIFEEILQYLIDDTHTNKRCIFLS